MEDPRIEIFRDAARNWIDDRLELDIPCDGRDDALGQLGDALIGLRDELRRRALESDKLLQIARHVSEAVTLDEVFEKVYDSCHSIIPYDRIGFALLENEGSTVRARWARTNAPEIRIDQGYSASLSGSSLEDILSTGQPRVINDLEEYLREHPGSESTQRIVAEGVRSSLTCPLIALGKPVGFVFFSSREPAAYHAAHTGLFQQIAAHLSLAVEKGQMYQRLLELNEIKNRFLGIAAHDLRNPIGVIRGYLSLFLENIIGPLNSEQRQCVMRMGHTCESMLTLIDDLLDISAIESGSLELAIDEVDPIAFLGDFCEEARMLVGAKSMHLQMILPEKLPGVRMDAKRIRQALSNLITNAVKFSYPASTVTLTARQDGGWLELAVQDEGQGIPSHELPKLFSEFSRTSVQSTAGEKSTGLGQAIVKRMIVAHGGDIQVDSTVGEGSTFIIRIPMAGPPDSEKPAGIVLKNETAAMPRLRQTARETDSTSE